MSKKYIVQARVFKAMSDENRLKILELLHERDCNASELLDEMDFGQSTLSHHMKVLCECGLVKAEKDWKWTYYTLACCKLNEMLDFLGDTKCRTGKTNEDTCKKNTCD